MQTIVEQLRAANPFDSYSQTSNWAIWDDACDKVEEILNQQSMEWKQAFRQKFRNYVGWSQMEQGLLDWIESNLLPAPAQGMKWRKDFSKASFERAAGRHAKNGKYAYLTILKVGDNLFNVGGDHLYDKGELEEVGIEWLDESDATPNEYQVLRERLEAAEKLLLELWAAAEPSYEGDDPKQHSKYAHELFSQWKILYQS